MGLLTCGRPEMADGGGNSSDGGGWWRSGELPRRLRSGRRAPGRGETAGGGGARGRGHGRPGRRAEGGSAKGDSGEEFIQPGGVKERGGKGKWRGWHGDLRGAAQGLGWGCGRCGEVGAVGRCEVVVEVVAGAVGGGG
nr:glycine-rich cell wall structural protein 2-like [Lolium perenne]